MSKPGKVARPRLMWNSPVQLAPRRAEGLANAVRHTPVLPQLTLGSLHSPQLRSPTDESIADTFGGGWQQASPSSESFTCDKVRRTKEKSVETR